MQKPHNNQELFSNYYLEERLPERDAWQQPEGLPEAYEEISDLYEERKDILGATKEAQTEEEWIKPILDVLGFKYITQPSESIFDTTKVPDYAFFLKDEDKKKAYKAAEDNKEDLFNFALAVGDAKRWDRNLNELRPNKQIDEYLRITNSEWGILTNGRLWRIYHLDSSYRLDTYYEVDLVDLIEAEDTEKFKYFYLFFRPRSFIEDGFLTEVYERSEDFTASVTEDLKENAFDALRELCQGFLSGKPDLSEDDLDDIYENSLVLLYRIIFLLYAESDEEEKLLPMDNERYRKKFSLTALKEDVVQDSDKDQFLLSSSHRYWSHLRDLFSFIDKGQEKLGVYEYNGGLFDRNKHPFLDKDHSIGDKYLAEAIRKISYSEAENGFIDYQDLDVRELGAIYEGLLEHKPVVEEKQVRWKEDLYERKKTGSYYTPEYIVKYIVENTIDPLVEEKKEEIEEEINELEEKRKGSRGYDRETYERKLEEKRKQVREEILNLKILDPAMGSGHFLVEATEKLANSIASLEEEFSPEEKEEEPDTKTKDPGRKNTVKGLKREIVERSIYGVDKNPLATELAKLSLWLHTVAKGKPLSFLDHHLRTGDSLVGIDIEEMKTMPSERELMAGLFTSNLVQDLGNAIGHLNLIEEITSGSRDDVQEKKAEWRDVRNWIDKYKKAADVRLSTSFGNEVSDDEYRAVLQAAAENSLEKVEGERFFTKAQEIARENSFFHWELEFPDIFRDRDGSKRTETGFDVVIGNPPWIDAWTTTEDEQRIRENIKTLWARKVNLSSHWDIYVPFLYRAINLTKNKGRQSFILPSSFASESYAKSLRERIISNYTLESFVDFKTRDIFKDVSRKAVVQTIKKEKHSNEEIDVYSPSSVLNKDPKLTKKIPQELWNQGSKIFSVDISTEIANLLEKVDNSSNALGHYCYVNYGAQISSKEKGEFEKSDLLNRKKEGNAKKCLEGNNINRYEINWEGKWLDYNPNIMYGPRVPELFESPKLIVSKTSGKGYRLRAAFDDQGFYTDQRCILITDYSNIDDTQLQSKFKEYNRVPLDFPLTGLLGLINSKLMSFYFANRLSTGNLQGEYSDVVPKMVRKLPIKADFSDLSPNSVSSLVGSISNMREEKRNLNLRLQDYIGKYEEGQTLRELYVPKKGISDSILQETASEKNGLKIGSLVVEDEGEVAVLKVSARYKPKEGKGSFQNLDQWGYTETDLIPAMQFPVGNKTKTLIKEFVPLAAKKAEGFANFRKNATKTISPLKRLEKLTLPKLEDVKAGLEKYLEQKEKAEKLKEEIQKIDHQIDAIVFDLYDLNEEEVRTVLDSLETPEDEKTDILEKFNQNDTNH